jgi:type IV pilus assembly protein PilE
MNKRINTGFTLIELMIVVAIVGILASIAYPSYIDSVRKGKRAQGRAALTELLQQEERFMTQTNSYCAFSNTAGTVAVGAGCTTLTAVPFKTYAGDSAATPDYYLSAGACPPATTATDALMKECVMVSAQPTFSDTQAGTLQIISTGTKTCSGGSTPSVCWK